MCVHLWVAYCKARLLLGWCTSIAAMGASTMCYAIQILSLTSNFAFFLRLTLSKVWRTFIVTRWLMGDSLRRTAWSGTFGNSNWQVIPTVAILTHFAAIFSINIFIVLLFCRLWTRECSFQENQRQQGKQRKLLIIIIMHVWYNRKGLQSIMTVAVMISLVTFTSTAHALALFNLIQSHTQLWSCFERDVMQETFIERQNGSTGWARVWYWSTCRTSEST